MQHAIDNMRTRQHVVETRYDRDGEGADERAMWRAPVQV